MTSLPAGERDEAQAVRQLALIRQGLSAQSVNLSKLVAEAQQANRNATSFVASVSQEPAATADVQAIKSIHRRKAEAFETATIDYRRGLRTRNVNLLKQGDAALARATRLKQRYHTSAADDY